MIAVVTGGRGFIGQNLTRRLLRDGHDVRCLVRESGGDAPAGATPFVVRYDDPKSLDRCAAFDGAAVVFHLAGATQAVRSEAFMAANVTPTRHLLAAMAARRLQAKFVYVSSQAAAGPAASLAHPVAEGDAPRPVEDYGRSKLSAERVVESFADRIPATIVRPCAVFGPHDRGFLTLFRLAERGMLLYPGTADHWLSLLHVDDVVQGLVDAAQHEPANANTFFLSSIEAVQWRALGALIAAATGGSARHVNLPPPLVHTASVVGEWIGRLTGTAPLANRSKAALARQRFWVCSAAKAREAFGFTASRSLPDAVRDTYYWYRQNGWVGGPHRVATAVA